MKKILSIDFDYFIDAPIEVRNNIFPDGADEIPAPKMFKMWNECYEEHPDMYDIGLLEENTRILTDKLNNSKFKAMYYADSHKKIWEIISSIPDNEELFVTNIDFHHDNYISGGNSVDCANWVRHLMNRPKSYIEWIAREDSAISSLTGDFPYGISFNIEDVKEEYDYVFLCFSPEWTPPHLYGAFTTLLSYFEKRSLDTINLDFNSNVLFVSKFG